MHPMKKDSQTSRSAKLRKMTAQYGAADPAMNKPAAVDQFNQGGEGDATGFGTDFEAPRGRSDRRDRVGLANPVATLKRGGHVKRAHGGAVKGKGKGTSVNVIIAPQGAGGANAAQPPLPPALAGLPPSPAGAAPPPAGPPMGGPPMHPPMLPPPGAMPPGIVPPRKRGGRVHKHDDEAEDKAMIRHMVKPEALQARARGGKVHSDEAEDMAMMKRMIKPDALKKARARGGEVHMTAGAGTGEGRLEKLAARERRRGGDKAAAK